MEYKNFNAVSAAKSEIEATVAKAIATATLAGTLPQGECAPYVVETPADPANGDFSVNAALVNARVFRLAPPQIAAAIVANIELANTSFEKLEVAGPGFINFYLKHSYYENVLRAVHALGENYGRTNFGAGERVNVEFVSANPTGPMHLGNARGGALGDGIAAVLSWAGYDVSREFLINDAGNQIARLGHSLSVRYLQHFNGEASVEFPEDGYHSQDIIEHAKAYIAQHGDSLLNESEEVRAQTLAAFVLPKNIAAMKAALEKYNIQYDTWFSEQSLHDSGAVMQAVQLLTQRGYTYVKDGATWYKATQFGSEKDEVLLRANGVPTYFAADIAYHYNKFATRGFARAIDIWGADHHGHVARMKGAMDAIGLAGDKLDIILMQLVRLVRAGEPVRMSKRAGNAITLNDLLDEIPIDAARFMFNMREPSSQMDLDLDIAVAQSSENPVYYVQYAHARICSLLKTLQGEGITFAGAENAELTLLTHPTEIELIRHISYLPGEIQNAARTYDPARITRYVIDLATLYHKMYTACRVKGEAPALVQARLALTIAARTALANCLGLLKVSIPEQM
ncbi:arginine--tRNA ligase [Ruminococcaceae bacterium OttesenSCG-928-N02]|nr:arginine--tRNA ligase [Ruminococcaceae bacterium OttesenSCG-928-N02]